MSVDVFVDTGDLYHKLHRYHNAKLDYALYLDYIEERFGEIREAIAYGSQTKNEATGFITCLKGVGFTVKYKRPRIFKINDREIKRCEWGCELTVDAIRYTLASDTVILGVSNTDYIPLISYLRSFGAKVVVFASHVPGVIEKVADEVIEIPEDLFEEEEDDED